jgi:IS1 family transposase
MSCSPSAAQKSPAFIVTVVERAIRRGGAHTVCAERTPEVMQAVVDSAPHAARYFSDAFNTCRELCYWGAHQAMSDKSQTYSVEGDNAELRHYLARLARRARCFSKCIRALRRAVELFIWSEITREVVRAIECSCYGYKQG